MKKHFFLYMMVILASGSVIAQTATPTPNTHLTVCQDCGIPGAYDNITDAVNFAQSGYTINVHGEETIPGSGIAVSYDEHLLLDKQIVLTCDNPHSAVGYPVITTSFVSEQEIIRITPAGSGTVIRNLEIWGPNSDNTTCSNYPIDHFLEKAGIRIEADDCCIENCRIIRCMTGIIIGDQSHNTGQGNSISSCKIGDRWLEYHNQIWECEEYWSDTHYYPDIGLQNIIYPGNGFGIVAVEPDWSAPTSGYESIIPTEIVDCEIRSNRYYGVVLTNASKAQVNHNIIAFNGDWSISISDTIPDKSGGILSLFTAAQIDDPANDNEIQSPMIRSNNIYGNKGYQIGVFTGHASFRRVYNSPVIMSNNIGIEENMPPITSLDQYNFLICCGPTPLFTATPAPTITPTGTYQPDPTATSAPPGSFSYNYHGSGPIFAWNNYNDITYTQPVYSHTLSTTHILPFNTDGFTCRSYPNRYSMDTSSHTCVYLYTCPGFL